jgi:stringent starvation protein B
MTSNRPYLIRAVYEWIADNGMTPHLLVDAQYAGLRVPLQAVKDGRVVLNIAARAVNQLELGNEEIRFLARFGGVSQSVRVPLPAVLAIYALESGQGMALPEDATAETSAGMAAPAAPTLTSVAASDASSDGPDGDDSGGKRGGASRGPHLRVVK